MSKAYQRRRQVNSRRNKYSDSSRPKPEGGISIFRPVNETQAERVRNNLAKVALRIPEVKINGLAGEHKPGLPVLFKQETCTIDAFDRLDIKSVKEHLLSSVPTLNESMRLKVSRIGRIGSKDIEVWPMTAIIESKDSGPFDSERGELEAVVCELNDWNPVGLRNQLPFVRFASVPANSDPALMYELKNQIHQALEGEILLQPAIIR